MKRPLIACAVLAATIPAFAQNAYNEIMNDVAKRFEQDSKYVNENRDKLPGFNQSYADAVRCSKEMNGYLAMASPGNFDIFLTHELPSYECHWYYAVQRRTGLFSTSLAAPSKAEYQAWVSAIDNYLEQPIVRKVVDDKKQRARVSGQARYPLSHFDLDDYAVQKNYDLVLAGRKYLLNLNPINTFVGAVSELDATVRPLREACSDERRDAAYAIQNKVLREQAVAAFTKTCKDADKRIAEAQAKAKARSKTDTYKLPTEADLLPFGFPQKTSDVEAFFKTPGLLTRTVGADDAKVTMQVILDFDDDRVEVNRARRFLTSVWPAVRDGQLKLIIAPTSAASGEVTSNAAFLVTPTPYAFIDAWMERSLDKNASATTVQGSWLRYQYRLTGDGMRYSSGKGLGRGNVTREKLTDEDGKRLWDEMAAEASAPQPTDEIRQAIKRTPDQLMRSSVRIIPSFRLVAADGSVYPGCVGYFAAGSQLLRGVGVTTPAIYSKAQVEAWSKPFTGFDGTNVGFTVPPFDFKDELRAAVEPDWDNARQVCGGGECWKAPAPKKRGWF